jgi:cytochrome P450
VLRQVTITPEEDAARRDRFPAGADLTFADLEEAGREEALDRLREAEPVSWVPALGGWLVTGHAEVRQMLSPHTGATVEAEENLVRASLGRMMLTTDGDERARLRAPFERPFRMRDVGELFGEAVAVEADALLAGLVPAGSCELGEAFAAPFAVRMTGRVLGLSLDDVARIDGFYSAFAGAMVYDGDPEPQRLADAARGELNAVLHADLARCRREPDASITSEVSNDPDPGVDDDETVAQLRVIMFGGIETIQAAIMNTILLLLRDPVQLDAVRADRTLLAGAVEESLRLIPPVAFIERWTAVPTTIGAVDLGPGEFLGGSVLAANRDPRTFPDPLRYDVRRENGRRHLAFSFGEHFCLGAHLARLEIVEALGRLLDRLPGLRLVECEEPSGFAFRRPARLELAWGDA